MSYRISYDTGPGTKKARIHFSERSRIFLRLFIVLIVCGVGVFILSGHANKLVEYILPGDPETTRNALSTMADEIKDGSSFKEAITTFCRNIVADAQRQG